MPNDSSKNPLLFNFEPHAIFCGFTALYLVDLLGNREDRFSHDVTHMIKVDLQCLLYLFSSALKHRS